MNHGHIPGIERPLSRLVQGTAMIGGHDPEWEFALLDAAFEHGITTFDTGHNYGNGKSERTLGRWLSARGLHDQVVVIGKGAHHSQDRRRVTPFDISADLHDSLARLQTDTIDLYLLHRDDPTVPVGPLVEVLNEHLEAGRIGAFGGSNWSHQRLAEANAYAAAHGLTPFVVSSPNFSLAAQLEPPWENCVSISGPSGAEARGWYQEQGMALVTWSSLAGGFFSGRFRRDNLDSFDGYFDQLCVTSYCSEDNFQRLDRAKELGRKKGLSLIQVALAYVLNKPLSLFALIGPQNREEIEANVAVVGMDLTEGELGWLEEG